MSNNRSLLGLHFDIAPQTKDENKTEVGHSIDPENYESDKYSIIQEDHVVIFPT